jgi:hypothetical protein
MSRRKDPQNNLLSKLRRVLSRQVLLQREFPEEIVHMRLRWDWTEEDETKYSLP